MATLLEVGRFVNIIAPPRRERRPQIRKPDNVREVLIHRQLVRIFERRGELGGSTYSAVVKVGHGLVRYEHDRLDGLASCIGSDINKHNKGRQYHGWPLFAEDTEYLRDTRAIERALERRR